MSFKSLIRYRPESNFYSFAGIPVLYHCHHFNLFLDQTIQDALGIEEGILLQKRAAHIASYRFLSKVVEEVGVQTPIERLQLASKLFSYMGHGKLHFQANQDGGVVRGDFLHYGYTWKEKYGQVVSRSEPTDAFGGGFAAAAVEVAFGLPYDSLSVEETSCVAQGQGSCEFQLQRQVPREALPPMLTVEESERAIQTPHIESEDEGRVQSMALKLKDFFLSLESDERGLLQGFGVFVVMHLAEYYNRISYEGFYKIVDEKPFVIDMMTELLRESGHVCGFHTFGGILLSPEWEGLFGSHHGDPKEILLGGLAIARALGIGHCGLSSWDEGKKMVMQASGSYESVFHAQVYPQTSGGMCFFYQGLAGALVHLSCSVPWKDEPKFDQKLYYSLFQDPKRNGWKVKETRCLSHGDKFCEISAVRE
ncbi:MAG: hypothetical protein H6728_04875 [Myxococcales bacterium]|nr:hypothetical protein [Myxococcales bacterium]MCB9642386.1 hypothetical protein [Myxococcales bacterium]